LTVERTEWVTSGQQLAAVRRKVFVEEQKVPVEIELDDFDETAAHWLACYNDIPVGTCRMLADGHIGRLAVLKEYRGLNIGKQLLVAAVNEARKENKFEVYLYAQTHARDFYQAAGFAVVGEEFMDAGIPHLPMKMRLGQQRRLGEHSGDFFVSNYSNFALELIKQATRIIRVISFDLDPKTFGRQDMLDSLSALARKSRYTDIKLLVVDTTKMTSRTHPLLTLQRRLSSHVHIRKTGLAAHEISDNVIIVDNLAVLVQSIKEPDKAWGNYNNRPVAENYQSQFDTLWEHASEDPCLRLLTI